jgi:hypothetical protein
MLLTADQGSWTFPVIVWELPTDGHDLLNLYNLTKTLINMSTGDRARVHHHALTDPADMS